MDETESDILQNAVLVGSWHMYAETVLAVASLVRAGLISLNDDYEGIRLIPTDAGKREAVRLGLVVERAEGLYELPRACERSSV